MFHPFPRQPIELLKVCPNKIRISVIVGLAPSVSPKRTTVLAFFSAVFCPKNREEWQTLIEHCIARASRIMITAALAPEIFDQT